MTLRSVGIVGTGAMGRGIAEVAAARGLETVLVKATPGALDGARRYIAESLGRAVKKGKLSPQALDGTLGRLTLTSDLDALSSCDVVIESIVEDLGIASSACSATSSRALKNADGAGDQYLVAAARSARRLAARAAALRRPALLLAGAGDEAGRGGHDLAHLPRRRRDGARAGARARQDAGDGVGHVGLHRQPPARALSARRDLARSRRAWRRPSRSTRR